MSKLDDYEKYMKKCEMLGTKMFEFEREGDSIVITRYIPNNEAYRIVKIPDFVEKINGYAFRDVNQKIKIIGKNIRQLDFFGYKGDEIDISELDTGEIEDMLSVFGDCTQLRKINIKGINTSNTTKMIRMFSRCYSLEQLDLSDFNTSKVETMMYMFNVCTSLRELDIKSFDTREVKSMRGMFSLCTNLERLDLSNFDTSKVADAGRMFKDCRKLKELNLRLFNIKEIASKEDMFLWCDSLELIITNKENKEWLERNRGIVKLNEGCRILE